jgi:hypothetical protein
MDKANLDNLKLLSEYKNIDVLFRFSKLYDIPEDDIEELFEETKKWLYAVSINSELYKKGEVDFHIAINDDLLMLDEMWHNFILFSADYKKFCEKYFGVFIYHQPMTFKEAEKNNAKEYQDFDKVQKKRKEFFKKQYAFIYDLLGEETLVKWHKNWPVKYSVINIKSLRK